MRNNNSSTIATYYNFFPSHTKKKLEGKLSSPAKICDDPNLTNTIEHDSPLEAENLEEDEVWSNMTNLLEIPQSSHPSVIMPKRLNSNSNAFTGYNFYIVQIHILLRFR